MTLATGATWSWGDGMLLVRIVHFLIGAVLAGGGGFLAWTERARALSLFPPDPAGAPWLLVAGVAGVTAGVVFLASAVTPRPKRAARAAAEAERRREALAAADAFYAERSRAADRDWRSGDLPPVHTPAAPPHPPEADLLFASEPAPAAPRGAAPRAAVTETTRATMMETRPAAQATQAPKPPETAPAMPELALTTPMRASPPALKPVATSAPPPAGDTPFPSMATLTPIPRPAEPPPAPVMTVQAPAPSPTAAGGAAAGGAYAAIRAAIADGRLAEADKLLTEEREKAQGQALAELTGLAGDHAAAAGRTSNAKWLWRLALKRFGELNAMDSPAARAVSERLRLADQ